MNITEQEKRWIQLIIDAHFFQNTTLLDIQNRLLSATDAELESVREKTVFHLKLVFFCWKKIFPFSNKTNDEWIKDYIEFSSVSKIGISLETAANRLQPFQKGGNIIGNGNTGFGAEPIITKSMKKPVVLDRKTVDGGFVDTKININDLIKGFDKKGSDTSGKG